MMQPYSGLQRGLAPVANCVGDPYYNGPNPFTIFSLHGASLADSSAEPKTITNFGVTVSTAQSRFGGSSLFFASGTPTYLAAPATAFQFVAGTPFTVEFYIYLVAVPSGGTADVICLGGPGAGSGNAPVRSGWAIGINTSRQVQFRVGDLGVSTYNAVLTTAALSTGVWVNVAVSFFGTAATPLIFFDGVLQATTSFGAVSWAVVTPSEADSTQLFVGQYDRRAGGVAVVALNAYVDDLRVTAGVARYTANFTPPNLTFCDSVDGLPAPITPPPAPAPTPAPSTRAYVVRAIPAHYQPGVALTDVTGHTGFVETPGGSYPGDTALLSATVSASNVPPGITSFLVLTNTAPFPFTVTVRAVGTPTTEGSYDTILNVLLGGNIVASGVWPVTVTSQPELTVVIPSRDILLSRGIAVDLVIATLSTDIPATITFIGEPVWFAAAGLSLDLTWSSTSGTLKIVGTPTLLVIYPAAISAAFSINGGAGPVRAFDIRIVP